MFAVAFGGMAGLPGHLEVGEVGLGARANPQSHGPLRGVELQIDNFPTAEALHAWFEGAAFQKNPLGVTYDPDELAAKFKAGVPVEELVVRVDE